MASFESLKRFSSADLGEILVRALCANFYAKSTQAGCCCYPTKNEVEVKQKKVSVVSFKLMDNKIQDFIRVKFNVAYKYIITRYIRIVSTKITREPYGGIVEEPEKMYEARQYANYIPYDETCVLKTEVKECEKCAGEGYINVITTNHHGVNYEHKKRCEGCLGNKSVVERLTQRTQYRNRSGTIILGGKNVKSSLLSKEDGYVLVHQDHHPNESDLKLEEFKTCKLSDHKLKELRRYYAKVTAVDEDVIAKRHILFAIPIYKVKYKINDSVKIAIIYGADGKTIFKRGCCSLM